MDYLDEQDKKLTVFINNISHTTQKHEVEKLLDSIQGIKHKHIQLPNAYMDKYNIKITFNDIHSLIKFMNQSNLKEMQRKLQYYINVNQEYFETLIIKKINLSASEEQIKEIILEYLYDKMRIQPTCIIRVINQKYDKFALVTFIIKEEYQQAYKFLIDQQFTEALSIKVFGQARKIINMAEVERRRDNNEIMVKDDEIICMPVQKFDKEKRQTHKPFNNQFNKFQSNNQQFQNPQKYSQGYSQYEDRYQPNMNRQEVSYQYQQPQYRDNFNDFKNQYQKQYRPEQQQYGQPAFYKKVERFGHQEYREQPQYNNRYERPPYQQDRYGNQYTPEQNTSIFMTFVPIDIKESQIKTVMQRYGNVKYITVYPHRPEHTYKNVVVAFYNAETCQHILNHQDEVKMLGDQIALRPFYPKSHQ